MGKDGGPWLPKDTARWHWVLGSVETTLPVGPCGPLVDIAETASTDWVSAVVYVIAAGLKFIGMLGVRIQCSSKCAFPKVPQSVSP